ncbi:MAG TPA: ATP-binding cassette domain-containing protein, partial [Candidatus Saccharimonadales bacterium]|nr:ATP-binding cassette domain-containing protein [Candidatus Saccharimonadales bacterium]
MRNQHHSGDVAVSLEGVRVEADGGTILKGINFSVLQGERTLITGPSGSGKSTALRVIAGIETPTMGKVEVYGKSLGAMSEG